MTDIELVNYFFANPAFGLIFALLSIWALVWKGFALWKAARNMQKKWFIAILFINTFGILEIIYLFYLSNKKTQEITEKDKNGSKVA